MSVPVMLGNTTQGLFLSPTSVANATNLGTTSLPAHIEGSVYKICFSMIGMVSISFFDKLILKILFCALLFKLYPE